MEKEGGIVSQENIVFINQLISSLEEAQVKLEQAIQTNNASFANELKRFILEIQKRIDELLT